MKNRLKNGADLESGVKPVVIFGGAGFIGTNVAHRYLSQGQPVLLFDNLSRAGVERNWEWLRETHGSLVELQKGDIRDATETRAAVRKASRILHFAAQVAVTTSLDDPLFDFEVNCRGTLNVLEAIRQLDTPPPLIFTSTNKVYGEMEDVELRLRDDRYEPVNESYRTHGFNEERQLRFHSPYGCSKGAAEQYVLDYARTFKIPAAVFRMSCIYGPHQFGNEDQGWVAHFLIRALERKGITIYGDGKQVRDILFVEDLVEAFVLAQQNIQSISGEAFNIGGGPRSTISLLELIDAIEELNGTRPAVTFSEWRPADQRYYVSDTRRFSQATGWRQKVGAREGIAALQQWLRDSWQGEPLLGGEITPLANRGRAVDGLPVLNAKSSRSKRLWSGRENGSSRKNRALLNVK